MSSEFLKLPPPPTIEELIKKWGLTPSEYKRVFENHDDGDEDTKARSYGRWVCGRYCDKDPNHFGSSWSCHYKREEEKSK